MGFQRHDASYFDVVRHDVGKNGVRMFLLDTRPGHYSSGVVVYEYGAFIPVGHLPGEFVDGTPHPYPSRPVQVLMPDGKTKAHTLVANPNSYDFLV